MGLGHVLEHPRCPDGQQRPKRSVVFRIAEHGNKTWSPSSQGGQVPKAARGKVHGDQARCGVHHVVKVTDRSAMTCPKVQRVASFWRQEAKRVAGSSYQSSSDLRTAGVPATPFLSIDTSNAFTMHEMAGVGRTCPIVPRALAQSLCHGPTRGSRGRPRHLIPSAQEGSCVRRGWPRPWPQQPLRLHP
jgi:hypothetical protein